MPNVPVLMRERDIERKK